MKWLPALLLTAQGAMADVPPQDYFAGVYEQVGRSADPKPALIDRLVRLARITLNLIQIERDPRQASRWECCVFRSIG